MLWLVVGVFSGNMQEAIVARVEAIVVDKAALPGHSEASLV